MEVDNTQWQKMIYHITQEHWVEIARVSFILTRSHGFKSPKHTGVLKLLRENFTAIARSKFPTYK